MLAHIAVLCQAECVGSPDIAYDGDDTAKAAASFDSLLDELGRPDLKGMAEGPAPEPVDEALLERFVAHDVDADTEERLCYLTANYREWAAAHLRALNRHEQNR